jgi:hypothetical protein
MIRVTRVMARKGTMIPRLSGTAQGETGKKLKSSPATKNRKGAVPVSILLFHGKIILPGLDLPEKSVFNDDDISDELEAGNNNDRRGQVVRQLLFFRFSSDFAGKP